MPRTPHFLATLFLALPLAAAPDRGEFTIEAVHAATPGRDKPLAVDPGDRGTRARWGRMVQWYHSLPADKVVANPRADQFPGPVKPAAERVDAAVEIRLDLPRWQSTGLYAPAGEPLAVELPANLRDKGLRLRIGCHSDNIMRQAKWRRFPVISRTFELDRPSLQAANPFGGLVYVEVPRDDDGWRVPTFGGATRLGSKPAEPATATLRIRGAVRAPWFRLGTTTPDQWREALRQSGAPWGEIAGRGLVLSLPADVLRRIDDPAALAGWWDRVLDECWEFAGYPGKRRVPERIVPDLQISAGFMHSGYPIMCQLRSAETAADLATLRQKGNWGFFHELGHNHQGRAWTFDGFTEVTVNLHTLHLMKTVCGLTPAQARKPYADLEVTLRKRLVDGNTGPFEQLALYVPLIEAFGSDSLTDTFRSYLNRDDIARFTARGANRERMDAWVRRYSTTVGRDCSAYFAMFGIESDENTRRELSELEPWMPDEGFAERYRG
jgi:hypothetical protein